MLRRIADASGLISPLAPSQTEYWKPPAVLPVIMSHQALAYGYTVFVREYRSRRATKDTSCSIRIR